MMSSRRSRIVLLVALLSLVCVYGFRSVPSSWRNIRLRAAAADGGDDASNEKGKNGDKNNKNTSGNDDKGNEEPLPPLKMPRAMIKPSNEETEQRASPPEQFDSGIGSKNKSSRRPSSRTAAVAASKEVGGVDSVKNNWKFGLCKHRIAFEATETIKRMRFKVCVVDMTTGDILSRYFEHTGEITALDFDGERLCSGGLDGVINIYHTNTNSNRNTTASSGGVSGDSSSSSSASSSSQSRPSRRGRPRSFAESDIKFSDVLALEMMAVTAAANAVAGAQEETPKGGKGQQQVVLESLHSKQVTGMRLLPSGNNSPTTPTNQGTNNSSSSSSGSSTPPPVPSSLMVTCGLDKKLVCVDVATGSTVYSVTLDATPICMDVDPQSGSYVAVGLLDGRVQFFSARRGVKVMEFRAHAKKVQSIFMESPSVCLTGGSDGVIRRWDLSGERTKKEADVKQWATNTATTTNTATNTSPATANNKITPSSATTATATATTATATSSPVPVPVAAAAVARVLPPRQRFLDFYFQDAIDAMQQTTASTTSATNSNARANNIKTDRATTSSTPTTTSSNSTPIENSDGNGSGISGATKVGLSSQLKDAVDSYSDREHTSPVVALQADADKVLAVYADGMIRSWDATTGMVQYEMQGRSSQVSSLQFDDTMLVVDGTHSVVVLHDFGPHTADPSDPSSPPGDTSGGGGGVGFAGSSEDDLVFVIEPPNEEVLELEEEDDDGVVDDDDDDDDDGQGSDGDAGGKDGGTDNQGDTATTDDNDSDDGIPSSTT